MKHDSRQSRIRSSAQRCIWYAGLLALFAVGTSAAAAFYLQSKGVTPRSLAPYIEKRSSGHNPLVVNVGKWTAAVLMALDRGETRRHGNTPMLIGAQLTGKPHALGNGRSGISVATSDQVRTAIANAQPGDVITLMPGTYLFRGQSVIVNQPGMETSKITLRAEDPGTVLIEFNTTEGFLVSAPYWTFENLSIRGVCSDHSNCEHAFHVVARGEHFVALNNTIIDFNAHFKINGSDRHYPDYGLIEGNTLTNTNARKTSNPVTLIDLVGASHWTVRRNLISDFIKDGGDRISYGAFAKGAGSKNVFEQNIVLCEHFLKRLPGQRVGISLGGGGTGKPYCRDGRCVTEQDGGIIRSNLIASCSDDGIYLNSAATSQIIHNTLIDTGGVVVRFPESSADVEGNLIDGAIQSRNNGALRLKDNLETKIMHLYFGHHPMRRLFMAPETLDFSWKKVPPRRLLAGSIPNDLCGAPRTTPVSYGAFEDFSACLEPLKVR